MGMCNVVWLGGLVVACRTGDREIAGSTLGQGTAS